MSIVSVSVSVNAVSIISVSVIVSVTEISLIEDQICPKRCRSKNLAQVALRGEQRQIFGLFC